MSKSTSGSVRRHSGHESRPDRTEPDAQPAGAGHEDPYYIHATTHRVEEPTRVLKSGETFAVVDQHGDIVPAGTGQGLYFRETRFLSSLLVQVNGMRPILLSSTVRQEDGVFTADLTNPDMQCPGETTAARGSVHLFRTKRLEEGLCVETLQVTNYGSEPVQLWIGLRFESDFADIFEVRGTKREARGTIGPAQVEPPRVTLPYVGLDCRPRRTRLSFDPAPDEIGGTSAGYRVDLAPGAETGVTLEIRCLIGDAKGFIEEPGNVVAETAPAPHPRRLGAPDHCAVYTSNELFNDWFSRSASDLRMMITETPQGPYPYAGVPWFSTAFGRDGIVTALQLLWADPSVARGVLGFLAARQADQVDPPRDAEPGKILHETRQGEMAVLGEVPFGLYYGSVDSTPLFVILAGAYFERTADLEFASSIWDNVERALAWIERYGDADGDGFVEYSSVSEKGLVNQGWKDSQDAIFHDDGSLAQPPIALCEVQGYVYLARLQAARLASALGRKDRAVSLEQGASVLRERFEQAFWLEELGTYALALDREKRPCRVRASNAGQLLWTGIVSEHRARRLALDLVDTAFYSGFGIRTLAAGQARYNPMSYHDGSVWPHDNAIIALGMSRHGFEDLALRVMTGIFEASLFLDLNRMPELFCGFPRRPGEGPTRYPVACAPQAWAAGAVYMLLQACLGMSVDAAAREVRFRRPVLPGFLERVRITNLKVGDASIDLLLERHAHSVGINLLKREGSVQVIGIK